MFKKANFNQEEISVEKGDGGWFINLFLSDC